MNHLALELNRHIKDATLNAGFIYADIDDLFEGHRFCDYYGWTPVGEDQTGNQSYSGYFQTFWKTGFDTGHEKYLEPSLAHPTADGQAAYLTALYRALRCSEQA